MMYAVPMKTCTKCLRELSTAEFNRNSVKRGGFLSWCKACARERRKMQRTSPTPPLSLEDRFWSKVIPTGFCWYWSDTPAKSGYGRISINNTATYAHRVAWELLMGPIPEGLTIDHLCHNKLCVNPDHLEPVTFGENASRARNHPGDRVNRKNRERMV